MAAMFAKVFSQIFDSTIAEDYRVRHIFMDLLVMADSDGVVDKTIQAISRIANVPIEQVEYAIDELMKPDLSSRTPDHEGRRLQLIDSSRSWGWKIVNFEKYREIRDEEARRIANRSYKRMQRDRQKCQQMSASNPDSQQCQPIQKQKREAEAKVKSIVHFVHPTLEEIFSYCQQRGNKVDHVKFFNYYEANGWKVGRNHMKNWKAAIHTWELGDGAAKKSGYQQRMDEFLRKHGVANDR